MATKLSEVSASEMRAAMVDSQLRTSDVTEPAVVAAMGSAPREVYVPAEYATVAYMDRAIPLGSGRALNAPLATGRMLVALAVESGSRALLIGGATGYAAELLVHLGASVTAVEEDSALLAHARSVDGTGPVDWIEGPLTDGATAQAPFDRIFIDGAIETLPQAIVDQLAEGGRLVTAQRDGAVCRLALGIKTDGAFSLRPFADMDVVPLPGFARAHEFQF